MLFLSAATEVGTISLSEAAVYAILGYSVVFFGLILLMCVVMIMGKIFVAKENRAAANAEKAKATLPTPEVPKVSAPEAVQTYAPGTAGQLKLYDTPPKTAAMIMAIVANQMGKPLNELRFISIKEVKD